MNWLEIILGALSGGALVSLLTMPSIIKKAKAEAKAADNDNALRVADGWKQLADERQEANADRDRRIRELNEKIDNLYVVNSEWRDKYNAQQEEITLLKVAAAADAPRLCERRGCPDRTPPTGY